MIWRVWVGTAAVLAACIALYLIGEVAKALLVPALVIFVIISCVAVPYRGRARRY